MTREAFIRKWLDNPLYPYCENNINEMRDDLDKVIQWAQSKQSGINTSIVRPASAVCDCGEPLCNEGLEKSVSAAAWLVDDGKGNKIKPGQA